MAFIRCPDGVVRDYAEWEDKIKPLWKKIMKRESSGVKLKDR